MDTYTKLNNIIISRVRVKLLLYFCAETPDRHMRDLARLINEETNAVGRELRKLKSVGFLSSYSDSNRIYYKVNRKFELYDELKSIANKTLKGRNVYMLLK